MESASKISLVLIEMPRVARDPNVPVFQFEPNPQKQLSDKTIQIYRNHLNKITEASYQQSLADKRKKVIQNKKDLLAKSSRVVDIILNSSDSRQTRCGMFSAVFYAVGEKNLNRNKKMKSFVEEFRKIYYDDKYLDYLNKKEEAVESEE